MPQAKAGVITAYGIFQISHVPPEHLSKSIPELFE